MSSNFTPRSMDKRSKSKLNQILEDSVKKGDISEKIRQLLYPFLESYLLAFPGKEEMVFPILLEFLHLVKMQYQHPFQFEPYHERIVKPFNYYAFGLNFIRPLLDRETSSIIGEKNLEEIEHHLEQKHNVIFFANHQIEADPQAIALLLKEKFPLTVLQMIFVAGERVITDPLAVPFSMGCNLLCIYSKRYIDYPSELKTQKQLHNKKTMRLMSDLLQEGGKCIYVAPSGGRDRRNAHGEVEISPFDPQSIEMFYLMAKKSKTPTFFYPMALGTYDLLPPPETIQVELGEKRSIQRVGIHLAAGTQIDMEYFPGSEDPDKHVRRKSRADYIWKLVHQDYIRFPRTSK